MAALTLVRGAEVFAPEPLGRRDLLIGAERILRIAPHIPRPRPALISTRVVDARGRILCPGLVDQHVHLAGGGGEGGFDHRTPPLAFSQLTLAGVTTAVGLLGTDGVTRSVQDVVASTRALTQLGITGYAYTGAYALPTRTITGSVRADILMVGEVLGCGEIAIADDRGSHPSEQDLAVLAAEARVGGLLSGKAGVVHLHVGDGVRGLSSLFRLVSDHEIPIRHLVPTHLNRRRALLEDARRFAALGGTVDLTAGIRPEGPDHVSIAPWDALKDLLLEGVDPARITMSSDAGGSSPIFDRQGRLLTITQIQPAVLWESVRRSVAVGVPLETVLATVTAHPARVLELSHKGRVVEGADADFLLLDEDLGIREVWARGRRLVAEGVAEVRGPFEPVDQGAPVRSHRERSRSRRASSAPGDPPSARPGS